MRMLVGVVLVAGIAGCASRPQELAQYGKVELDGANIRSLSITKTGLIALGSLPGCVASTVRNDSVTLSDSSGSFVGATGRYYQAGSRSEVGGGSVLQYVSPDESKVVAKGGTSYVSALIQRSVRFTLNINDSGNERVYKFTGIQQVQNDTGYMANTGYRPVHTAAGGGSGHVLKSLNDLVAELETCIL